MLILIHWVNACDDSGKWSLEVDASRLGSLSAYQRLEANQIIFVEDDDGFFIFVVVSLAVLNVHHVLHVRLLTSFASVSFIRSYSLR